MPHRAILRIGAICLTLACASPHALAQDENADALLPSPTIPMQAATAEGFAPPGWKVLQKATGDLDADGRNDLALILENEKQPDAQSGFDQDGETGRKFWPRILVVALAKTKAPGYRQLLANTGFITVHQFGSQDDVLDGEPIAISRGVLSVSFHQFASMGSWSTGSTTFKFRCRNGAMALIGMDRYTVHRASLAYSDTSINFLNHRASVTAGNEGEDAPKNPTVTRHRFSTAAPDLATMVDGLDYWPEGLASLQ